MTTDQVSPNPSHLTHPVWGSGQREEEGRREKEGEREQVQGSKTAQANRNLKTRHRDPR